MAEKVSGSEWPGDHAPSVDLRTDVPHSARMYDYYLGGKDNFAADREAAEKVLAIAPELRTIAREGQDFRRRLMRYLTGEGITQFITFGAGLPTQSNIHELAQESAPGARCVYVEDDTVVLTHARALLATDDNTGVVRGHILRPDELIADPGLRALIDFDRPVGLLLLTVLQYIPDADDPFKSVARLRDALPSGSHLALTHVVFDDRPEAAKAIVDIYQQILGRSENISRTFRDVERFFDGWELVEPGLVYMRRWRPDTPSYERPEKAWMAVGVGRKN